MLPLMGGCRRNCPLVLPRFQKVPTTMKEGDGMASLRSKIAATGAIQEKLRAKVGVYAHHPGWALMRAVGRFDAARAVASMRRRKIEPQSGPTVFDDLDVTEVVATLERDGCYTGLQLPKQIFDEIWDFARRSPCYGDRNTAFPFRYDEKATVQSRYDKTFAIASYKNTLAECPAIGQLAVDSKLRQIAESYLRAPPALLATTAWWSFAVDVSERERSLAAQMFHFDLDDYRFLKFFFYMTDVDKDSGPHVCVRGTHTKKALRHQLRLQRRTDEDIESEYGAEQIAEICGPAGYGFAEDTRAFHKGSPPVTGDRLVVQIEFARNDYQVEHDKWEESENAGEPTAEVASARPSTP